MELLETFYIMQINCNCSSQVQAELHKDPQVKPEQVSISRSGGCISLHSRPSNHDPPFHVHAAGAVSPIAGHPVLTGKSLDFVMLSKYQKSEFDCRTDGN